MNTRKHQGFTIIEVVLVLAIAGLIFLMVFLALPALNRGQRDNGRKSDVGIVTSALNTYLANNKSSFTGLTTGTLQSYVDNLAQYDKATQLTVGTGAVTAATNTIQVRTSATCPATMPAPGTLTVTLGGGSSRQAAVVTALENNGSQAQAYCQSL